MDNPDGTRNTLNPDVFQAAPPYLEKDHLRERATQEESRYMREIYEMGWFQLQFTGDFEPDDVIELGP